MMLCLDLGTKTGWAARTPTGVVTSGVVDFAYNSRYEGGGMRFLKFQGWLNQVHYAAPVTRVVFEEVKQRAASVAAGHVYGGFLGHLTSWCEANQIPYQGVPVATIKKTLTNDGGASKDTVKTWVRSLGFSPKDDNEADALAILFWLEKYEAARTVGVRPAPDSKPRRRIQVEPVRLARRPMPK